MRDVYLPENKRITMVICTNMEISKFQILKDEALTWMQLKTLVRAAAP